MAQTDRYVGEAYEALKRLSADEKKRLEYEAREMALRGLPDGEIASQCDTSEERVREILAM